MCISHIKSLKFNNLDIITYKGYSLENIPPEMSNVWYGL